MKTQGKNNSGNDTAQSTYRCLEDVIGCKWSVSVLLAAGEGVTRPGAMEKYIPAISTKVLNERLRKLSHYGLLEQTRYAESPPRTEYTLTEFGHKVVGLIAQLRKLDKRDWLNGDRFI